MTTIQQELASALPAVAADLFSEFGKPVRLTKTTRGAERSDGTFEPATSTFIDGFALDAEPSRSDAETYTRLGLTVSTGARIVMVTAPIGVAVSAGATLAWGERSWTVKEAKPYRLWGSPLVVELVLGP